MTLLFVLKHFESPKHWNTEQNTSVGEAVYVLEANLQKHVVKEQAGVRYRKTVTRR